MGEYSSLLLRIAVALEAIAKNSKPPRRNPLEHPVPVVVRLGGQSSPANAGFVESQPLDGAAR